MNDNACCLESCPALDPLMELLRIARVQNSLLDKLGQNYLREQCEQSDSRIPGGQRKPRGQRNQSDPRALLDLRDLSDGPQVHEILKAIGECPALLSLAHSDLAVEAERAAHEEKIKNYL
ncbi:MAG: hypothetical protein LBV80_09980 [Deltaproteobacteria bacterium]|nr:hypothetical protein [Deltaproteobacteria bacterium]